MRILIDLQGRNKTKKTMARADRSSLHGLAESARTKEKGVSCLKSLISTYAFLLTRSAVALAAGWFFLLAPVSADASTPSE